MLKVVRDGLLLDVRVGLGVDLGVALVHPLQVQAAVDVVEVAEPVEPDHQLLVVEHLQALVVSARLVVRGASHRAHMVGRVPDVSHVVRGGREGVAAKIADALDLLLGVLPPVRRAEAPEVGGEVGMYLGEVGVHQ
jgi:hypothetical protein